MVVGVAHEAIDLVNQHDVDRISMLPAELEHFPEDWALAGLRARTRFDEEPLQRPPLLLAVARQVGCLHLQAVALGLGDRGNSDIRNGAKGHCFTSFRSSITVCTTALASR